MTTSDIRRVLDTVARAQAATEERLSTTPGFSILLSIRAQLAAIREDVEQGTAPNPSIVDRLTLGLYAIREFEPDDPAYARLLKEVQYYYKALVSEQVV